MDTLSNIEFETVLESLEVLSCNYKVASMPDEKVIPELTYAKICNIIVARAGG